MGCKCCGAISPRVAIVRKKAVMRGIKMPDDVVCYIAAKVESNTRELEGAITSVQGAAALMEKEITLELAQQALGDEPSSAGGARTQLSIQNIIDTVTSYYGVKLSDLQSKRRHRSITTPRQICMYLARKRTAYSLEEIGGYFGGRDHTTVMHAVKTVGDRITIDPNFSGQIEVLDKQLYQG